MRLIYTNQLYFYTPATKKKKKKLNEIKKSITDSSIKKI